MSHGAVEVAGRGDVVSLGSGALPVGVGREYYAAVGEYLRVVGRMLDGTDECSRGIPELVEGWCRIACPVLSGCCSGVHAELSAVGGGGERVEGAGSDASVVEGGDGSGVSFVCGGPSSDVGGGHVRLGCTGEVRESDGLCDGVGDRDDGLSEKVRGKQYWKNKKKKLKAKSVPEWRRGARPLVDGSGGCVSDESATGSVRTVDTRTGVEIEAAQTLAACRVAENRKREAEAKVAAKLAEHRLVALQDKDRTVAVQRLAAARYEQKINEARAKSQASYKKCDESMKSLGSTGSAGEFALKQMVKEAKDNAKTLKYVQEQADLFYQYATPEVRRMVAEMPEPEMEDEFEVFGDCPSDYNDEQREAYYDDLNRRNAEHGLVGTGPPPPRREPTPEELLRIEEEVRALSMH